MKQILTEKEILFMSELYDLFRKYDVACMCAGNKLGVVVGKMDLLEDDDEIIVFREGFDERDILDMLVTNKRGVSLVKETENLLLNELEKRGGE